jgi:hypothetical protein
MAMYRNMGLSSSEYTYLSGIFNAEAENLYIITLPSLERDTHGEIQYTYIHRIYLFQEL